MVNLILDESILLGYLFELMPSTDSVERYWTCSIQKRDKSFMTVSSYFKFRAHSSCTSDVVKPLFKLLVSVL